MIYKELGNTNVKIPSIGLGTMGIGGYFTKDTNKDNFYINIIRKSIDLGMTFIDTAEIYGAGHSERLIGEAIYGYYPRKDIFIATKVSPEHLRYNDVIESSRSSCSRLKTDYIDLYQIHWANPTIPLNETLLAMKKLLNKGKIKYVGVCNFSLKELMLARSLSNKLGFDIVSNQVEYNLFDRTIEDDILPYCKKNNTTIIAYSPLDNGKFRNYNYYNELDIVAKKYDKTVSQLILRWLIENDGVIVIPKSINIEHIKDNVHSNFDIDQEDIEFIDKNFKLNCVEIPVENIFVNADGLYKFVPKPEDLANSIRNGDIELKPIKIKLNSVTSGKLNDCNYELVEGKIRYWAWIYAHNGSINDYRNKKIPPIKSLIRKLNHMNDTNGKLQIKNKCIKDIVPKYELYRSQDEDNIRKEFTKHFKKCPIPDNELLSNLGLFISSKNLSRIFLWIIYTNKY